jgi:hypothetical protein
VKNSTALILIAVLLLFGFRGRVAPEPEPAGVAATFDDYRVRMSAAWGEGAAMKFDSDRQAWEWIKSRAEMERKAAFAPVHQREQDTFGGEKWDDAKRAALWVQFAEEAR